MNNEFLYPNKKGELTSGSPAGSTRTFVSIVVLMYLLAVAVYSSVQSIFPVTSPILGDILTMVIDLILIGMALWGLRGMKKPLSAIGITFQKALEAFRIVLLALCCFALLLEAATHSQLASLFTQLATPPADIITNWLFVAPAEETLFRGYILSWLLARFTFAGKKKGILLALVLTSLLFATIHLPKDISWIAQGKAPAAALSASMITKFALGALLAYIFLRTNNIVLAILVHGFNNAPLIGEKGDLLFHIFVILIVEIVHFVRQRRLKQAHSLALTESIR